MRDRLSILKGRKIKVTDGETRTLTTKVTRT